MLTQQNKPHPSFCYSQQDLCSYVVTLTMKVLVFALCCLLFALQAVKGRVTGTPLPRASAKPVNVDPKLDCAIKELAWSFGNQMLTEQVQF